jgi:RNA recognition motif-containing protein
MSVEEKQARSVFVGNIPHGTTEDQMREIFSVIGPVLSFRIVFDRETGNPKGYGFAEYTGKNRNLLIRKEKISFNRCRYGSKCN